VKGRDIDPPDPETVKRDRVKVVEQRLVVLKALEAIYTKEVRSTQDEMKRVKDDVALLERELWRLLK